MELVDLIEKFPEEFMKSEFSKEFENFDGSSGMDLHYGQSKIVKIAEWLIKK